MNSIRTDYVGTPLKEYKTKIEARDISNFAASILDDNPMYLNDERPGGIIAPPTYCVAITWDIVGKIWDYIEDKSFPFAVLTRQVHYSEHIRVHRNIKPNDKLIVRGEVAAILPRKSSTHVALKFECTDQKGEKVFTEYNGAILRGIQCEGEPMGESSLPTIPLSSAGEDTVLWQKDMEIHPLLSYLYDGCTHIHFPIHTSPKFAKGVGLPGIILQGTATLSLSVKEIINHYVRENPAALKVVDCRFKGMVFPGETIQLQILDEKQDGANRDIFFRVISREKNAIDQGYIRMEG